MNPQADRLRAEAKRMRDAAKASRRIDQREEADMYRSMAKDYHCRAIQIGSESLEREAKRYEELADKIDKQATQRPKRA